MLLLCRRLYLFVVFFLLHCCYLVAIGIKSSSNTVYPYRFFNQICIFTTFESEANETLIFAFLLIRTHTLFSSLYYIHSVCFAHIHFSFFFFFWAGKICSIYYITMFNFFSFYFTWEQVSVYVYAYSMNNIIIAHK